MATASQRTTILAGRATAGADYATKAAAMANAFIELAGYDLAVKNGGMQGYADPGAASFSALLVLPLHAEYLRAQPLGDLSGRIYARHAQLVATITDNTSRAAIVSGRATAGSDYATKAAALIAAYVELAAYDRACSSHQMFDSGQLGARLLAGLPSGASLPESHWTTSPATVREPLPSFNSLPEVTSWRHATYAPVLASPASLIAPRIVQLQATLV